MATTNKQLEEQIKHLSDKMDKFITQYHTDMHGDSGLQNGERGVIGNIRWLKDQWVSNPSFLKIAKENPGKTLAVLIVGIPTMFLFLHALVSIPTVDSWLMALLNIPAP